MRSLLFLVQDPTSPWGALILAMLIPILGWAATKIYDGIKTLLPFYDKLPAVVHQALAPLVGAALGWVTVHFSLVDQLTDVHDITASAINAILVALAQLGIFRWEKRKMPADATVILEQSRADSDRLAAKARATT